MTVYYDAAAHEYTVCGWVEALYYIGLLSSKSEKWSFTVTMGDISVTSTLISADNVSVKCDPYVPAETEVTL